MSVFAHPQAFWLLALLPLLASRVARARGRRARDWAALGQGGRLRGDGGMGWLAAIACLVVALAQPRWGMVTAAALPPGHDVVLLVDASRSMGAEDAVPNRLGVAVKSAKSLIAALGRERGNRVALVAFSGRGVTRCPLTENLGAASDALEALSPGAIRPGGTDLGAALDAAAEAFDAQDHAEGRTVVLFSDGEDHAGTWSSAFDRLREAGIVVHSVAIGDPEQGHPVPPGRGPGVLTYRGAPVLSKRDDRPFEAIARETGGAVVRLGLAPADLGRLYVSKIAPVARQKREAIRPSERTERFGIFILAALGWGLAGSWPGPGRWPRPHRWMFLVGILAALGASGGEGGPAEAVGAGRAAYAGGRHAEALAAFERAISLAPSRGVPRYDAAAALFQLGRYPEALARYQEARERAGAALRTKIDYALGNTALALGDIPAALGHYDACLTSTARGADLDAVRRDAAINRRFAEEQAQPPTIPPEPDGDTNAPSRRPQAPKPPGDDDGGPDSPDSQGEQPGDGGDQPDRPSSNRRGAGGPGGTGSSPPQADSPEERLASAMENIREARRRRLDEQPSAPDKDRMDW